MFRSLRYTSLILPQGSAQAWTFGTPVSIITSHLRHPMCLPAENACCPSPLLSLPSSVISITFSGILFKMSPSLHVYTYRYTHMHTCRSTRCMHVYSCTYLVHEHTHTHRAPLSDLTQKPRTHTRSSSKPGNLWVIDASFLQKPQALQFPGG